MNEITQKSLGSSIWRLNAALEEVNEALMDNGGDLTPELEEKLAKAEMSQGEIADGLHELIRINKAGDTVLGDEIKRLQALKKSRANALEGLKRYLLNFMQSNGIEKIKGDYCTVTVAAGRESVNCDEQALLSGVEDRLADLMDEVPPYIVLKAELSKSALLDYMKEDGAIIPTAKEGEVDVPLASIVRNPYLIIK